MRGWPATRRAAFFVPDLDYRAKHPGKLSACVPALYMRFNAAKCKGTCPFFFVAGTVVYMTELLNELLTRMNSDDATPIGVVGTALWPILRDELREMLLRAN